MFSKPTRKIVTGIEENISTILSDDQVLPFAPYNIYPSFQIKELFYTEDPQSLSTRHLEKPYNINLPQNAVRFMIIRMPTKKEISNDLVNANMPIPTDWTKFNLHTTDTVDYIYVLSGQITCIVDDKEVHLNTGDFLTQIGAEHTWINDHEEPCQILCVMIGTEKRPNQAPVTFD